MLMSKARKLGCVRLVVSGVMLPKARLRSSWAGLGGVVVVVVVGLDIMIRISFLFLLIMIYSLVMILGWVDQIGRKGNIVYSSSCSLSFVPLSLYT